MYLEKYINLTNKSGLVFPISSHCIAPLPPTSKNKPTNISSQVTSNISSYKKKKYLVHHGRVQKLYRGVYIMTPDYMLYYYVLQSFPTTFPFISFDCLWQPQRPSIPINIIFTHLLCVFLISYKFGILINLLLQKRWLKSTSLLLLHYIIQFVVNHFIDKKIIFIVNFCHLVSPQISRNFFVNFF